MHPHIICVTTSELFEGELESFIPKLGEALNANIIYNAKNSLDLSLIEPVEKFWDFKKEINLELTEDFYDYEVPVTDSELVQVFSNYKMEINFPAPFYGRLKFEIYHNNLVIISSAPYGLSWEKFILNMSDNKPHIGKSVDLEIKRYLRFKSIYKDLLSRLGIDKILLMSDQKYYRNIELMISKQNIIKKFKFDDILYYSRQNMDFTLIDFQDYLMLNQEFNKPLPFPFLHHLNIGLLDSISN